MLSGTWHALNSQIVKIDGHAKTLPLLEPSALQVTRQHCHTLLLKLVTEFGGCAIWWTGNGGKDKKPRQLETRHFAPYWCQAVQQEHSLPRPFQ